MRKLIYHVAVTLDGLIAGPGGETDAFLGEGDHMPWLLEHLPETIPGHVRPALGLDGVPPKRFDTVVMGRRTHQVAVDAGLTSGYPHMRQVVVSRHGTDLPGDPSVTVTGDPVPAVRALKAEESDLDVWLCGGGTLACVLAPEIDELWLKINPVLLGSGVPLFGGGDAGPATVPQPLKLLESRRFESGVLYARYATADTATAHN